MKNIRKVQKFLSEISNTIGGKPTIQKVQALIFVYNNEPCTSSQVKKAIGSTIGGTSKTIHDMTSLTSRKKPGIGILEVRQDPMNLKSVNITVSSLGKKLLDPIFKDLEEDIVKSK